MSRDLIAEVNKAAVIIGSLAAASVEAAFGNRMDAGLPVFEGMAQWRELGSLDRIRTFFVVVACDGCFKATHRSQMFG